MEFNPIALASTIVGGLIVAALIGWIRKPRLIVLVPRSFSYSQITDRGQLVEISVFNRGFNTEETIDVTLNHAMRYELVGSNSQEVRVSGNKITIPRVGPSDDVTVLLLVEQGTFKSNDIIQCLSKETKGRTVEKVENIPPNGPQRISIVGGFVVIPFFLYGLTFGMDYVLAVLKPLPSGMTDLMKQAPMDVGDWKIPSFYKGNSLLLEPFVAGKINASVGVITRKGDVATIPVTVTNHTDEVLTASFSINSAGSAKRFKSFELRTDEFIVVPGKSETRSIRVVVPETSSSLAERTAFIDAHLKNMTGQTLSFQGAVEVK